MDTKSNQIIVGIALVLIGGVIGWVMASKNYGQGPLANLQSIPSSANEIGICARLYGEGWRDNGVTPSGFLKCSKKGEQDIYVNLRPDTEPMLE